MLLVAALIFALLWLPIKINVMLGPYNRSPSTLTPTRDRQFLALF